MLGYLPIVTNLTNHKPAFLYIEDVIMCPECSVLSKLSFLHAVLFEKKDGTSQISIQYFCFKCNTVITVEKEVFLMNKNMHVYSFDKPVISESVEDIQGNGVNSELPKEEIDKILESWRSKK
jgi:hypothetical protein